MPNPSWNNPTGFPLQNALSSNWQLFLSGTSMTLYHLTSLALSSYSPTRPLRSSPQKLLTLPKTRHGHATPLLKQPHWFSRCRTRSLQTCNSFFPGTLMTLYHLTSLAVSPHIHQPDLFVLQLRSFWLSPKHVMVMPHPSWNNPTGFPLQNALSSNWPLFLSGTLMTLYHLTSLAVSPHIHQPGLFVLPLRSFWLPHVSAWKCWCTFLSIPGSIGLEFAAI